jgi:hypothetical protein
MKFFFDMGKNTPTIRLLIRQYRFSLIILALYTIITVLMTYPVAFSATAVAGGGDAFFYLWDLWWFKKALLSCSNPYFTTYLFYPSGLSLAYSTITPFNGIISVPLQLFLDVVAVYNILWMCTFIVAGYGTYLLVLYLTENHHAAFIAGLIYAFSPYHFAHALGHLSLITIGWIPFFILYLYKTINEDNFKNPLLACFFLLLVGLSDVNYLLYSLVFAVIFFIYSLISHRSSFFHRQCLIRISIFWITSGIGILAIVYPLIKEFFSAHTPYQDFGSMELYSADVLAYFTPSKLHPLFGKIVDSVYENFTSNFVENTIFIGFFVLFLVIVALVKKRGPQIKFWILALVLFIVLSLGPYLHFNGIVNLAIGESQFKILLPGIIQTLPIISMAHVPARWDVMVMLSVSVISGYGLDEIFRKYQGMQWRHIALNKYLSIIFIMVILFEYMVIPYPITNAKIPEYYDIFSKDDQIYAIYEIPDHVSFLSSPINMYYQTRHEKPILSGYTHISDSAKTFRMTTPLIRDLYFVQMTPQNNGGSSEDIFQQNLSETGKSILNYYSIRYIILHEGLLTEDQISFSNNLLQAAVNKTFLSYPNESVKIYLAPDEPVQPFITLGEGFSSLELLNGTRTRWISDNATIVIHSGDNRPVTLSFQMFNPENAQYVYIFSGKTLIDRISVPPGSTSISKQLTLRKGDNYIGFEVSGAENKTRGGLRNSYSGIALQNVKIS